MTTWRWYDQPASTRQLDVDHAEFWPRATTDDGESPGSSPVGHAVAVRGVAGPRRDRPHEPRLHDRPADDDGQDGPLRLQRAQGVQGRVDRLRHQPQPRDSCWPSSTRSSSRRSARASPTSSSPPRDCSTTSSTTRTSAGPWACSARCPRTRLMAALERRPGAVRVRRLQGPEPRAIRLVATDVDWSPRRRPRGARPGRGHPAGRHRARRGARRARR